VWKIAEDMKGRDVAIWFSLGFHISLLKQPLYFVPSNILLHPLLLACRDFVEHDAHLLEAGDRQKAIELVEDGADRLSLQKNIRQLIGELPESCEVRELHFGAAELEKSIERHWAVCKVSKEKKKAKDESPDKEKVWNKGYCPGCGGENTLEWMSFSSYAKACNNSPNRDTVSRRVKEGKYWINDDRKIPWCQECGEKAAYVTNEQVQVAEKTFRPDDAQKNTLMTWTGEEIKKMYPDFDLSAPEDSSYAYGYYLTALEDVFEECKKKGEMVTRDEAERITQASFEHEEKEEKKWKYKFPLDSNRSKEKS